MRFRCVVGGAGFLCVLFLGFAILRRPLWFDEILGHLVCQLAWPSRAVQAADAGVDLSAPGWVLLARLSEFLTGGSDRGSRWLALLGVAMAAVLVHRIAEERWGSAAAAVAASALLLTRASRFACDGRPYGLALGLAALALFAWYRWSQSLRLRWLAIAALAVAAATLVHYYAVLMLVPLAGGEIVRMYARKRWDWRVAVALAAAIVPLGCLLPHILRGGAAVRLAPFSEPALSSLYYHFRWLVDFLAWPLLLMTLSGVIRRRQSGYWRLVLRLTTPEAIGCLLLLILPAYAMLLSALGSGISHPRYALPSTLGMSLLAGVVFHDWRLRHRLEATLAVVFLIAAISVCAYRAVGPPSEDTLPLKRLIETCADRELPIVCSDPVSGLQAWYLADDETRKRIVIAADPLQAVRHGIAATSDINLDAGRRFFELPIENWDEIRDNYTRFLLIEPQATRRWLPLQLADSSASMTRVPVDNGWRAWFVDLLGRER
jgi:hypothetical protein